MNIKTAQKVTDYLSKSVSLECPFCHTKDGMRVPEFELDVLTNMREPRPITVLECSNCGYLALFNRAIPAEALDE